MVAKWREGFDVVYGVRSQRHGETWFKKLTAAVFYRLLRAMLGGVSIPVDAGDFRLMSRQVVLTLRALREQHRFVRGMVAWIGFRQTAVDLRAPGPLRRRDQVPAAQDAPLRDRRHHVLLERPAALRDLAGRARRHGGVHRRRLGGLREDLGHRHGRRMDDDHDPGRARLIGAALDDGHPRRIRGPHLRRGEAPAPLRRRRGDQPRWRGPALTAGDAAPLPLPPPPPFPMSPKS